MGKSSQQGCWSISVWSECSIKKYLKTQFHAFSESGTDEATHPFLEANLINPDPNPNLAEKVGSIWPATEQDPARTMG